MTPSIADLLLALGFALAWAGAARAWRVRGGGPWHAATLGGLHAHAAVLIPGLVLGALGTLRPLPWALAAATVGWAPWAWVLRPPRGRPPAGGRAADHPPDRDAGAARVVNAAALLGLAVAVVASGWVALLAVGLPETSWDGLAYHLPMAALALQRGDLASPPAALFAIRDLPRVLELLPAFVFGVSGGDGLVHATQLAALPLGAASVASLTRSAAGSPAASRLAGALFVLVPIGLAQAQTAYVDLTFASLVLAGWALVGAGGVEAALAGGIALGLASAGKATGIPLAMGAVFAALSFHRRGPARLAALVAGVLLVAGPGWWVSYRAHGNPVWPIEIRVLGALLAPGSVNARHFLNAGPADLVDLPLAARVVRSWLAMDASPVRCDTRPGGLGPLWPLLGLPAWACVCLGARRRPPWRWLALSPLPFVLTFPGLDIARYVLPLWGVGMAASGLVLDEVRRLRPRAAGFLALAAVCGGAAGAWTARWPLPPGVSAPWEGYTPPNSRWNPFPWEGPHGEGAVYDALCGLEGVRSTGYTDTRSGEFQFLWPLWCGDPDRRVEYLAAAPQPVWMAHASTRAQALVVPLDTPPAAWLSAAGSGWTEVVSGRYFGLWRRGGAAPRAP